jgi:hypothetical protein
MKAFNLFFCIVFIFFAALQYNDPDPYVWMPIYLYAALLCRLAFKGLFYTRAYIAGIVGYLIYAGFLFFTTDGVLDWFNKYHGQSITGTMEAQKPWIEQAREFFGLVILIVVLAIDYFYAKRKMKIGVNKLEK